MSQSRKHSAAEAVFNNVVAFGISYGINLAVLPWFRRELTDAEAAFWLTFLFSIVSIVRSYFVRRLFNWLHVRQAPPPRDLTEIDRIMLQEAGRVGPLISESLCKPSPYIEAVDRHVFPDRVGLPSHPRFSICPTCNAEAIQEIEGGEWKCLNPECQSGATYHHEQPR